MTPRSQCTHPPTPKQFEIREEQRANEARRAFMKYLFHEVRTTHYPQPTAKPARNELNSPTHLTHVLESHRQVRTPLNSLTMGIDMLKLSETLPATEKEYLDVMAGATEFMSDTLNNVLNLHKIEVRPSSATPHPRVHP